MQTDLTYSLIESNIRTKKEKYILAGLILLVLFVVPQFLSKYALSMINSAMISAIAIAGLNLISGYTGVISLGNAAFMGIGAYIAAILTTQSGLVWWISIPCGALVAMVVGLIIGIPALRLKGIYLLMATIALHFITEFALIKYELATNRIAGIRFPRPTLFGLTFKSQISYYYLFLIITILLTIFIYNLLRTAIGRSLMAVRDNESAAKAMGVNIVRTKLMSFAVSSFIIGIAGGLQGIYVRNVTAEMYGFGMTFDQLCGLFIGGIGVMAGPILGAAFITMLPDFIGIMTEFLKQLLPFLGSALGKFRFEIQYFIYGLCIVLVLLFKPDGLTGIAKDFVALIRKIVTKKKE